ncbi:MAG TPA: hypothetical protein VGU01_06900 [Sphingomicrobium sp.]|nr:hypothetical protein [Sphingomicrobium sp.]
MLKTIIAMAALVSAAQAIPADTVGQARGAALQADAKRALRLLSGVDPSSLSEKDRKFVICMRARFGSDAPQRRTADSFADQVLALYEAYWHAALLRPGDRDRQEKRLDAALRKLLKAPRAADLDNLLKQRLAAEGIHSLEGRTGLLRELMLWGSEKEVETSVGLPEGRFRVKVFYLDAFRSFGWSHYATCGRAATGGWTTDKGLYVVVPRYDSLNGEEFQVSFLGHEAQHFADKARFKDLKPWELEYRAKLVELALADTTRSKILDRFVEDQGDNPAEPHSYADRKLVTELVKRLRLHAAKDLYGVDRDSLQSAARAALRDDSHDREAAARVLTKKS